MNWNKITLSKFRQLDEIRKSDHSELDKVLFSVCIVFDKTEYELDNSAPEYVVKLTEKMETLFGTPFNPKPQSKVGKYFINYDVSKITFGQYVELAFFLNNPIQNAHYILATMSNRWLRKNKTRDHRKKANYFLEQPVTEIIGSVNRIKENFAAFNREYSKLFGVDKIVSGDVQEEEFNKRYGWVYSAEQVALYERIALDEAFALPIRQALNDLTYLKAKAKYEKEQIKKTTNSPV